MKRHQHLAFAILIFTSFTIIGLMTSSTHAQPTSILPIKHIHSSSLPIAQPNSNPQQSPPPPARYDLQIGWTFTQDFASMSYNVTAVAQTDLDGYGPAYLLNGLTDKGYWYQVGISYNWPYFQGGFSSGFGFNYQVFDYNQTSVYPEYGGGGISAFSGAVNSGDLVLLSLQFRDDYVIMFARDWNTSAWAIDGFNAYGAAHFEGTPYAPANENGYFTGLMTEWYHANSTYRDGSKVTYTNSNYALDSAWMWMDEYDPYDPYWSGAWLSSTLSPTDYTENATQIQTFTYLGATASSNAYQFSTGAIVPLSTSITLVPADQSTALSPLNKFQIRYTLNGQQIVTYAQNGTTTVKIDNGTQITLSGTSSASTNAEKWALNAQATDVSVPSGVNATFYYYNLVSQQTSYALANSGNSPNATITYFTAPDTANDKLTLTRIDLSIAQSTYQRIFPAKGTTVSIANPIAGNAAEQWTTTENTTWNVQAPNQIPPRITYNHQFLLSFSGTQLSWQWINSGTTAQINIPEVSGRVSGSGERVTSYSIDGNASTLVQPTTGTVTIPVFMNSPHQLTVSFVKQFQVSVDTSLNSIIYLTPPTINGDNYWYDQGTPVSLVLKSILNRSGDTSERLESFTVNGIQTNLSITNPVGALDLTAISSSYAVTQTVVKQVKLTVADGLVEAITAPSLAGDAGWYDVGKQVTATFDYSWNLAAGLYRTNALSYQISQDTAIILPRVANGTFRVAIAMTEPKTISITPVTQYALSFTGGFNIAALQKSPTRDTFYDSGTNVTIITNYNSEPVNGNTRQSLTSYVLDDAINNITRAEEGTFTQQITMNRAHELTFIAVTQYLVTFNMYDSTGNLRIVPTLLQIQTGPDRLVRVSNLCLWLDSGTTFQVATVMWQSANVKPISPQTRVVYAPLNESVICRIFDAKVTAKDCLGLPVGGAQVLATLINGTTIEATSDSDGNVNLPMVPLGIVHAEVSNLGTEASADFNAEMQPSATLTVFVSIHTLILLAATATLLVVALVALVLTQKKRKTLHTRIAKTTQNP